jgi:L-ascorbate metabolism protein UlaG (beta-lactamase superfamily)
VKITFYAHACFRLEADGLAVITDPYTPGPKPGSGFDPIDEPADLVILSSSTDDFHSDPSHVRGDPVIDALELPPEGTEVKGVPIRAFPASVIIPMHYYQPRGWLQIEPVDSFLARYPDRMITRVGGTQLELTPETLPTERHIYVLEQSR